MTVTAPPIQTSLEDTLAGVRERSENVSEVWAWLGGHELAREDAAGLFDEVRIDALPIPLEHTADELNA